MSDRMTPIPFAGFMNWILEEKKTKGTHKETVKIWKSLLQNLQFLDKMAVSSNQFI